MKKLDNKGFMLTETLVVAGFVIATLVFLYTQFRTVNRSYTISFKYNNAEELYALGNFADYLRSNGLYIIGPAATASETNYIDATTCTDRFLSESNYCNVLMESLQIKQVILTSENLDLLKGSMEADSLLSDEMKQFISSIKYDKEGIKYRLIAEFDSGTFATITVA